MAVGLPWWLGRAALLLAFLPVAAACAAPQSAGLTAPAGPPPTLPGFVFQRDTFAFPNQIRARHPDTDDLYANYCFVLARGLRQFFQFARFDSRAPRLSPAEYVERVRAVVARSPWQEALPPGARIVIPGYASLREFSRAEEAAVKAGLNARFWTLVHWTNWRVVFPVTAGHQARVAQAVVDQLQQGRLVQLLVTNWPKSELNHTVVAYGYRPGERGLELVVWDPNDLQAPGIVTFDRTRRHFVASRLYDTEPGPIRLFRMYHSWFL